jgi:hypothetical protein
MPVEVVTEAGGVAGLSVTASGGGAPPTSNSCLLFYFFAM